MFSFARVRRWWSRWVGTGRGGNPDGGDEPDESEERPWQQQKGRRRSHRSQAEIEARAAEVAQRTLGTTAWMRLRVDGHLDIPSRCQPGLTYRLRVGHRLQLLWDSASHRRRSPWTFDYLCINPTYPLPALEFAAQLYLYLRDAEDEVIRVAIPQPTDGAISNLV